MPICIQVTPSSPSLSYFMPLQFNWYTRRAVLTGVYNTTELVMIQDSSPDFEDTWRFLENRVADAMNMGNTANQVTLQAGFTCGVPLLPKSICRQTWLFDHADCLVLAGDCINAVGSSSVDAPVSSGTTRRLARRLGDVHPQEASSLSLVSGYRLSAVLGFCPCLFCSTYVFVVHCICLGGHECNCRRKQKVPFSLCLLGTVNRRSSCPGPDGSCSYRK